jgi:hypothetical protein
VETLQRSDLRADIVGRLERTLPPPPVMAMTRVGRGRAVRPAAPPGIAPGIAPGGAPGGADDTEDAEAGDADIVASPDGSPRARSGAPQVVALQALAGSGDRLLADAREACRREGIAATRRELLLRVAKRVGLPQAEVARRLGNTLRREGAAAAPGTPATWRPRDPVSRLATAILGVREREVFLARRVARPDDIAALHSLAACLGLSVERVYELEASARRKLARALR